MEREERVNHRSTLTENLHLHALLRSLHVEVESLRLALSACQEAASEKVMALEVTRAHLEAPARART